MVFNLDCPEYSDFSTKRVQMLRLPKRRNVTDLSIYIVFFSNSFNHMHLHVVRISLYHCENEWILRSLDKLFIFLINAQICWISSNKTDIYLWTFSGSDKTNMCDIHTKRIATNLSTHLPLVPHIRQWTGSSLVQVMVCCLFGAKPLPEPMLVYCQPDSLEQIWIGSLSFSFKKMHLKMSSAKMAAVLSRGGGGGVKRRKYLACRAFKTKYTIVLCVM